jgi:tetratricopeptide (TPR) repeat protein
MIAVMRAIIAFVFLLGAASLLAQKEFSASRELGAARQDYLKRRFDQALGALDRFDKATGTTVESLDLRGCIDVEQGKFDDAANAFESAHLLKYDAFAPRIHLADVMLRQKKFADARRGYEKLLDLIKTPMWPDYLRFGVLLTYLGENDEAGSQRALHAIAFPTETPAYYYAQAAWAFTHGRKSEGNKWVSIARKIFDASKTAWFDRTLYQFGWLTKKPAPSIDPFF